MSKLVLNGDTSGSVTLDAPAISGTTTLTLPTTSGTVLTTATGQTLTSPVIAGTPTGVGVLTAATAQTTTSGTSKDFTDIPSWVKRITVMFAGVSTNGTSNIQIQIGAGSVETSGYLGSSAVISSGGNGFANYTAGFGIFTNAATSTITGAIRISLFGSNRWIADASLGYENTGAIVVSGGQKTTSGTLDRIRITTVNGTDAFDAGSINILYE